MRFFLPITRRPYDEKQRKEKKPLLAFLCFKDFAEGNINTNLIYFASYIFYESIQEDVHREQLSGHNIKHCWELTEF